MSLWGQILVLDSHWRGSVGVDGGGSNAKDARSDGGGRRGGGWAASAEHAGDQGADEGAGRGAARGDVLSGADGGGARALGQGQTGVGSAGREGALKNANFLEYVVQKNVAGNNPLDFGRELLK